MTPPLPLPVRVAAGLVATAVEQARDLPRLALELPVTAVSQALQASMRVQQKVTELAIKGDRVLGVGPPIEDEPAWATFDEDPPPRRNGRSAELEEIASGLNRRRCRMEPIVEPRDLGREFCAAQVDGARLVRRDERSVRDIPHNRHRDWF